MNGSVLTVISMYLRPQEYLRLEDLDPILEMSAGGGLLIGADLNARHTYWGDNTCNRSGNVLREFLLACPNIDIHPTDGPTRITPRSSSFLDFFMTTADVSVATTSASGLRTIDYESDHRAVEIIINTGELERRLEPRIFDFDRMDRNRFNELLERGLPAHMLPIDRNASLGEIDNSICHMNTIFRSAMEESIPKFSSNDRGLLQLPDNILHLISEKKRLRRALWRTPDPGRSTILKADIRNLDRIIQGAIAVFEESYWTDYLRKIRVGNKTFRQVKRCAGILRRGPLSDLEGSGGTLVSDDRGKAELLASRFREIHNASGSLHTPSFVEAVVQEVSALNDYEPTLNFGREIMADGSGSRHPGHDFITPYDVGHALKHRANKRSSGNDGIPDFVLRKTGIVAWRYMAILFNHCMNIGYFPLQWKNALVVPIQKLGSDSRRVENYRPISLLSSFGKLLEFFILSRIRRRIDEGGVLRDNQFGFRKGHSTCHALMVFADYVARGLNSRYPTLAVSLDFAKAFDTAWQEGIVYKMIGLRFDRTTCRMVANFLSNRSFRIRVGEVFSDSRPITAGVPQGSLLGPVLYNIFISDIPQPPDGDLLLIYADDILIAARGPRARNLNGRMNAYLEVLHNYFGKWGLRLNLSKTDSVMIKGRRGRLYKNCRGYIPCLTIGGERILTSDRFTYLGIVFHENFEYYRHVDRVLERVKGVYHRYHTLIGRRAGLSTRVRLLVYCQIIRPLMSYAFPVWFGISSSQMERIRVWERRILSYCLGLGSRIRADGSVRRPTCASIYRRIDFQRVDVFLTELAMAFLERASSLQNGLVLGCFSGAPDLEALHMNRYLSPVDLLVLRDSGLLYGGAGLLFYHRRVGTLDIHNLVYNTGQ